MTDLARDPAAFHPLCAVCQKPVERVVVQRDEFFRQFHVIVECHGDIEECDLPEAVLLKATSIEAGQAFTKSRRLRNRS